MYNLREYILQLNLDNLIGGENLQIYNPSTHEIDKNYEKPDPESPIAQNTKEYLSNTLLNYYNNQFPDWRINTESYNSIIDLFINRDINYKNWLIDNQY
jgi:hypothetical protein